MTAGLEAFLKIRQLFFGHRSHFGVLAGFAQQCARVLDVFFERLVFLVLSDDITKIALSLGGLLVALAVAIDLRIGQLCVKFGITLLGLLQLADQEVVEAHTESASSRALMAVASCGSSGSFVVIFCSRSPGNVTIRRRLPGCLAE